MSAAIDCFARLGYQGTTIDRIARAAGVTKGAVYYHFRDKEELLFAAVKDRVDTTDGVHPNAEGQKRLAENVWKVLEGELSR